MPFQRFVESGRVAYVNNGNHQGKLVTIVDIIDQNRVLVDGPAAQVPRGEMRLSDLHLTKFKMNIPFTGSTRVVRKAWVDNKLDEKWQETMWAKKLEAKKKRAQLSDFDRFKLRRAKQIRNKIRTNAFFRLKKKIGQKKKLSKKETAAASKKKPATKKGAKK